MHNLKEVQQKFLEHQKNFTETRQDILAKEKSAKEKIEKLERKLKRLDKANPHWTDGLILPIMNMVQELTPQLTWDLDRLIPMGMRNATSVFGHDKDGNTITHLCFTPYDTDNGQIKVDTGKSKSGFVRKYSQDPNGFDKESVLVDSIDTIMNIVNAQLKKVEGCFFYKKMQFKPIRPFNAKEKRLINKNTFINSMHSIGVSNYDFRDDHVKDYSHKEFYEKAKELSEEAYTCEIFLLNGEKYVVPHENELFEYKDFEKNS